METDERKVTRRKRMKLHEDSDSEEEYQPEAGEIDNKGDAGAEPVEIDAYSGTRGHAAEVRKLFD
jgi:hypothetical protein